MKLTFLGATHEVTGSCTLLNANGKNILIDCGMEQGADIYENCPLPISPNEIDAILLTHAHIDHSGKIPAMTANGFSGQIYSTKATYNLCEIMLRDSAHIQEFEAEWRNRKAKRSGGPEYIPPYTIKDTEAALKQFKYTSYNEEIEIFKDIKIKFQDAGHLLGSSSIYVTVTENNITKTILFSGDLGNVNRPLINDPQKPTSADYVIIESTYGDREHGERPDYVSQLSQIMQSTFEKGGNLVIPSFAIGRTQELLYLIRIIKDNNLITCKNFYVYVDSPLAVEATNIYSSGMNEYYDVETLRILDDGIEPIKFDNLRLSITSEDSKMINSDDLPKVIISASGMCEAGRIRHHLKHNLWKENSTILFVGYQAEGTIGRKLIDGEKTVKLFGEEISVKANIKQLNGISGHADKTIMLDWLSALKNKPEIVFVNHGEDSVCDIFAETINLKLGFNTVAPFSGDEYDLITNECTAKGKIVKIVKSNYNAQKTNLLYEKLKLAGAKITTLISNFKKRPNKDIEKLTKELDEIYNKHC